MSTILRQLKLSDLTSVRQRMDESVTDYVQRFRDVRARCYSLRLTDPQIADLAFQGLLAPIKEKFSSQDFDSLSQLVQRVSAHEARFLEMKKESFWQERSTIKVILATRILMQRLVWPIGRLGEEKL